MEDHHFGFIPKFLKRALVFRVWPEAESLHLYLWQFVYNWVTCHLQQLRGLGNSGIKGCAHMKWNLTRDAGISPKVEDF